VLAALVTTTAAPDRVAAQSTDNGLEERSVNSFELDPTRGVVRVTIDIDLRNTTTDRTDGNVVRRGLDENSVEAPANARFVWDGTDDAGAEVPEGRYTARIRVTRPQGTYAHDVSVQVMPFKLWTKKWSLQRGDRITLKLFSAEPLTGKPIVTVNQPGIAKYKVPGWKVTRLDESTFKIVLKTRSAGNAGSMKVRVTGTDIAGGQQSRAFTLTLR